MMEKGGGTYCSSSPAMTYEKISNSRWEWVPKPVRGATRSSLITRRGPKSSCSRCWYLLNVVSQKRQKLRHKDVRCEREGVESFEPAMICVSALFTPSWNKSHRGHGRVGNSSGAVKIATGSGFEILSTKIGFSLSEER